MPIRKEKTAIHLIPSDLSFFVFSADEIRKLSATQIKSTVSFDVLGNPVPGGLYDIAMGPSSRNEICSTCMNDKENCTGHFGHIELVMPVFNPFFIKTLHHILSASCLACYRIQISDQDKYIVDLQLRLVDAGYIIEAQDLEVYKCQSEEAGEQVENEDGIFLHPKIIEFANLLKKEPSNQFNVTKNSEAIRTSIVTTTIRGMNYKICRHCKLPLKRVKYLSKKLCIYIPKKEMEKSAGNETEEVRAVNKPIFAEEGREFMKELCKNDGDFLKRLYPVLKNTNDQDFNIFFMDVLPVIPPIVRPTNFLRGELMEHPQTKTYSNVVSTNNQLRYILAFSKAQAQSNKEPFSKEMLTEAKKIYEMSKGENEHQKIYHLYEELQTHVDQTLDINMTNSRIKPNDGFGLKQIIEKKEGLIRMHMMGKRVNFAARTVITPDPNISIDSVGVPEAFALKLTYPVPVTNWNVSELRRMVQNGPNVHPGACYIENSNGSQIMIPSDPSRAAERQALANSLMTPNENRGIKTVHRHLLNGDILLFNRQPTLHKPSIMAHKARILKGEKTFRLHYSNCKSYNADFDGDEMNAHFPQNEVARSEGYNLVNVANQYLVPKDGTPLGGLIQDHVISGVKLSMRGRFFNKSDYHQLIWQGLSHKTGNIKLLPPAILKPGNLWSGKQIFSTLIINLIPDDLPAINLKSKAKIGANAFLAEEPRTWKAGGTPLENDSMTEAEIIIRNGELLVGILDKNHYGSTPYSLIHCVYELYGGEVSTQLLNSFARVFTLFLQWEGFTLGVHDILVLPKADEKRQEIIEVCRKAGKAVTTQALDIPEDSNDEEIAAKLDEAYVKDPKFRQILDRKYKTVLDSFTNDINKTCLPKGLLSKFPENNLQLMVNSGAKGSTVNTMQISCLLGQIELEGKRPPLMISGKSLPSFASFETSPKSGGFIDGRFMTGIQPQDFFFHCMAGREGLIDTAVKTSRSGYLQRCLIKHLEGLTVSYDGTVRDSDNSVIQFMYGEDGLDICKAQFLKEKQLSFLEDNSKSIVTPGLLEKLQNTPEEDESLRKYNKKLKSWKKRNGDPIEKLRISGFAHYSNEVQGTLQVKKHNKIKKNGRSKLTNKILQKWEKFDEDTQHEYNKLNKRCPDPVLATYKPYKYFGSISEHIDAMMENYLKGNKDKRENVKNLLNIKFLRSMADPGEPVGLLAAQSIGEPSTQMTLNTFHFAGRGEMNVTLGIPRLREILMMASEKIKTPSMDIPFLNQESRNLEKTAEKFRVRLNKVTVADVLESVNVKSQLVIRPSRCREYEITFNFLPHDAYKSELGVKPKKIIKHMHELFFNTMFRYITKAAVEKLSYVETIAKSSKKQQQLEEDHEDKEIDTNEPTNKQSNDDSSDDEPLGDDADATDERTKNRRRDEKGYDESDNEKESSDEEEDDNDLDTSKIKKEITSDNEEDYLYPKKKKTIRENEDIAQLEDIERKEDMKDEMTADNQLILDEIARKNSTATGFFQDEENYRWCRIKFQLEMKFKNIDLTNVIREAARSSIIWQIPHIKRAITYKQDDMLMLKTEGININAMFLYDKVLNLNKLYTNDIHAVAKTYGIEAARRVIVKEVQNVFKVYGITVDPRHLLLIADYMTFDGTFQPLSRKGIESSASPLQQMSFESSLQFLKTATVQGRVDNINSPSSCLMVGHPCKSGTGAFSLINDYSYAFKQGSI